MNAKRKTLWLHAGVFFILVLLLTKNILKVDNNAKIDKIVSNTVDEGEAMKPEDYFSNLEEFKGLTYEQALELLQTFENDAIDMQTLGSVAEKIRQIHLGNKMDLCSIMNVKSGSCSEDCKFCAQSAHYEAPSEHF